MHILHISGDYPFTPLYHQLLTEFSKETDMRHTMYVPLRKGRSFPHTYDLSTPTIRVIYSANFGRMANLLFLPKVARTVEGIKQAVEMGQVDFIHAHYLFSSGGPALKLKKQYGIPYITAVRNTDVYLFFQRMKHLRGLGLDILKEAYRVVFISPAYREMVIERFVPPSLREEIAGKALAIPNGISDFWFQNLHHRPPFSDQAIRLLFVGEIALNKNLETVLKVVQTLRERGHNAELTVVGSGDDEERITRLAGELGEAVHMNGWTKDKSELLQYYRNADFFIMPSFRETFGLVFIEAMSQGLPILYTRGQGVDGYFPQGAVGYACNPTDAKEIADRIESMLGPYDEISNRCTAAIDPFSWQCIVEQYRNIYLTGSVK